MNRHLWLHLRGPALASLVVLPVVVASCADSEDQGAADEPDTAIVPTPDASGDVVAEVGCEATEAGCPLTCDQAPWCPVSVSLSPFAALTSVWGSGKNDVWAAGSDATVIHWDGTSWASIAVTTKVTFNTVWGSGADDVWIAGATDTIFRSHGWKGASTTFERVQTPMPEDVNFPIFRIGGTSASDMYLAGRPFGVSIGEDYFEGNMFKRTDDADGGIGWEVVSGASDVFALWSSAPNDLWIAADQSFDKDWKVGLTFHGTMDSDSGGLAWAAVDSRSPAPLRGLWGSSPTDVWAVGDAGTIRHLSTATAHEWDIVSSPTRQSLHDVWGSAADDVWAVGDAGAIIHYDGHAWNVTPAAFAPGDKPNLLGVWGSSRDDVWIVGDGVVLHYDGRTLSDAGGGQ